MVNITNGNVANRLEFKKGDFIVDFGQVFEIIDTKSISTSTGSDTLLVFSPYFKTDQESDITSSIPQKNIDKTTIRPPMNKKQVQEVLEVLSDKKIKKDAEIVDVLTAKAVLNQNNPQEIAQTVRKIYLEKISKDFKFTSSKNYIFELLISRLAEEIALVLEINTDKATTKIHNQLKKK